MDITYKDCIASDLQSNISSTLYSKGAPKIVVSRDLREEYLNNVDFELRVSVEGSLKLTERRFTALREDDLDVDTHFNIYKTGFNISGPRSLSDSIVIVDVSNFLDIVLMYCSKSSEIIKPESIPRYSELSYYLLSQSLEYLDTYPLDNLLRISRDLDYFFFELFSKYQNEPEALPWIMYNSILKRSQSFIKNLGVLINNYIVSKGGRCSFKTYNTHELVFYISKTHTDCLEELTINGRPLDVRVYERLTYGLEV